MKRARGRGLLLLVFWMACVGLPVTTTAQSTADLCLASGIALRRASEIRGLRVRKEVPCVIQDKSQVRDFLEETIRTELPPDKMEMEQLAYRAIGMLPDDYDYGKNLVRFLVSELGGYYDPKRGRFVMAAWLPADAQQAVAVHELTHALQDQHYNLREFLDAKSDNGDRSLAYSALIEGDATAVMLDNDRRVGGLAELAKEESIEAAILLQILGMNIGGSAGEVPASLKAMLIFPYTSGLRFAHAILRRKGYTGLDSAYKAPPQSTREVLHPEEYLAGSFKAEIPTPAEVSALHGTNNNLATVEYSDVVGEFGISSLLSNSVAQADSRSKAAVGWKGDRLVVYRGGERVRIVRWLTRWESEQDAREFQEAYAAFVEDRYKIRPGEKEVSLSPSKSLEIHIEKREVLIQIKVIA